MAYKFTGRIKKIGCASRSRFCEFEIANTISINGKEIGVASGDSDEDLKKVPEQFTEIPLCKYMTLLVAQKDTVEIEFENDIITKVTVLR